MNKCNIDKYNNNDNNKYQLLVFSYWYVICKFLLFFFENYTACYIMNCSIYNLRDLQMPTSIQSAWSVCMFGGGGEISFSGIIQLKSFKLG